MKRSSKRNKSKRTNKRRKNRKTANVSKKVKTYVRREIGRQAENKIQGFASDSVAIYTYISNTNFTLLNCILSQGVGQGDRIGNAVRLRKATLRLNIWMDPTAANSEVGKYIDVYIVKYRKGPVLPISVTDATHFLQSGNGAVQYDGSAMSGLRVVNSDLFKVKKRMRFQMINGYTTLNNYGLIGAASRTFNIDCTKMMLKLQKYNDAYGASPTNDSAWLAIGASFTSSPGGLLAPQFVGYYSAYFEYQYEDS